ncbi:HD domain-containing protein [Comamonas sp. CMM01]|jgi:HD-GYP domain-containing protein (c-di-GMP phosphodiesterase class II)|nr:HD domain-containing phosphohydrolase [Comamonas terrigena]MBD9534050.1 HD domain-containing protein [Comamonas sp. CMM01]MDH1702992.1 HD domain-containing protein [Comamonas terrigena]SUY70875.1 Cyclic di-GMP phosphodiesterase response regulator RpfG [Comamonas terrigena]
MDRIKNGLLIFDGLIFDMRRILQSDLVLNEPLPWPLYDEDGNLLFREGYVLSIPRHINALLARGAYAPEPPPDPSQQPTLALPECAVAVPTSDPVFIRADRLAMTLKRLHAHLQAATLKTELRPVILGLAHGILDACDEDADALLAALHLDRQHPYLVIQQLLGATLVEMAARELGLAESDRLSLACAALTRDLSLLPVQAQLDQQAGALTPQQAALVRSHPDRSAALLAEMGVTDALWLELVRQHHERFDGSGYPRGLSGDAILPGARLLAIADSYAAMVTPRPNRAGQFPRDALKALFLDRVRLYDDPLVQLSIKTLTMHPPGTLVRLANGEFAVVRSRQKLNESIDLWSLYDSSGMPILRPQYRDSTDPAHDITGSLRVEDCRSAALVLKRLWMQS